LKNYIIKKIALLVPMLIGITLITFALTKTLPGDPVYSMVGKSRQQTVEKIRKEIGADRNVMSQYMGYLALLVKGEMGRSYYTNRKVF
jgi:peptide/nickel transport system permease protein